MPEVTQTFSVFMALRLPTTAYGYLISKGGPGASRYWALYSSREGRTLVFYYRIAGSSVQRSVTFEVSPCTWSSILMCVRARVCACVCGGGGMQMQSMVVLRSICSREWRVE